MGLIATVHDADNPWDVPIHQLDSSFDRRWREQLKDVGSGSCTVLRNHADSAWLTPKRYVKLWRDGESAARFCFRISERRQNTVASGEEAAETRTVSGPGVLATLADGRVEPAPEVADYFDADTRYFNFASPDYPFEDAGHGWGTSVKIFDFGDPAGYGHDTPRDWPDWFADWMWGTAPSGDPPMPIGSCYFRNSFNLASAKDVAFYIAADDGYELWVDGELIVSETKEFIWQTTKREVRFLQAGWHYVAIKGTNITRPSSSTNYAAILFSAMSLAAGGANDQILLHSDDTWACNPYPSVAPGWTAGAILDKLFTESSDRGAMTAWTWLFDADVDTNGNDWTQLISAGYKIGTSNLDVLRHLAAWAVDFWCDQDYIELSLFPFDAYGTASGADLNIGEHIESLDHTEQPQFVTDVLARVNGGTYQRFSSGETPRVEGYAELGTADSDDDASAQATALTDLFAQPRVPVTVRLQEDAGVTPYDDFLPGDTAILADIELSDVASDVIAVSVSERAASEDGKIGGSIVYDVECLQ